MSSDTPFQLLLGPQRPDVNLGSAIANSGIGDAPIAVISAAWQEAEGDKVATKKMKRMIRSIVAESPLRATALMSEGKLSMKKLTALIHVLNKRYLKAIRALITA